MQKRKRPNVHNYNNAYYNYSTEAYKYSPDIEYVRKRRKKRSSSSKKKINGTRKARIKNVKKTRYEFVKQTGVLGDFKTYFIVGTFFVFLIFMLGSFAINSQKLDRINSLTTELKQLEESNSVLQTEIIKNLDLEKIEQIATTKLKMQKPAQHQIVYINVPKQSYTVQYNSVETNGSDEKFSFQNIWNVFFGD